MAIYEWSELLKLWHQEKLTVEQAMGQVFLRLQNAEGAAHGNKRKLDQLTKQVAQLLQRLDALEQRLV